MRSLSRRTTYLVLVSVLAACGSTEPEVRQVSVSGSLTSGGQPVVGAGMVMLGVDGRPDPVSTVSASFDGSYAIAGQIDEEDCAGLFVAVFVQNSFGQIVAQGEASLGSCGTHVVDLVLAAP